LVDYSIYDAHRVGFDRVVLVVRPDLRDTIVSGVAARWEARVRLTCVEQREALGTAHAVAAAADVIDDAFGVANADDFYGRDSFDTLGSWTRSNAREPAAVGAIVTFPLQRTLPDRGAVNRAVVDVDRDGFVRQVREVVDIERAPAGGRYKSDGA